jgi:hypothetical protein
MTQPSPSISTEEILIDKWCARSAPQLWADYVSARAAAGNLAQIRRMMPLALDADETRRLAACNDARAALNAWLADRSERNEIELWARPGSRIEDQRRIPPSAVRVLGFDYEKLTARGEGLPLLFDVRVRQAMTVSDSVSWARNTTRRLLTEGKIPDDARKTKAKFASLLEAEAEKDVKAGQIRRAWKSSYLEDQLVPWGIWPLNSFK